MDDDSNKTVLQQIAQTLGVPEDVFWVDNDNRKRGAAENAAPDELELLRQFRRIKDPAIRRSCLNFVGHAADSDDQTSK